MPDQRLIRFFAAAFVGCVVVVAAINLFVDPYAYFGTPGIKGLTAKKPTAFEHDRFFKAGLVQRVDADCLLAGSSRVGEGVPPDHPLLRRCRKVLDVSMAGPNVGEMTSIISMATNRRPASTIVLSLDFFAFNAVRGGTRGGSATVFASDPVSRSRTALSILLSADVVRDSLGTLLQQRAATFYEADGSVNQDLLAADAALRPTRAIFLRTMRGYIFHILAAPTYDFKLSTNEAAPLQHLADFMREQHRHGTQVVMFFSPAHAWQWELVDALGLWPLWEQWKRDVVQVNESGAVLLGQRPFALWDFAGYRGAALEEVPKNFEESGALAHYWDASHFNRRLGATLLEQMLASQPQDNEFGWILTGTNADALIARDRSNRVEWRERFPEDVQDVKSVVGCFAPHAVQTRLRLPAPPAELCKRLTEVTR